MPLLRVPSGSSKSPPGTAPPRQKSPPGALRLGRRSTRIIASSAPVSARDLSARSLGRISPERDQLFPLAADHSTPATDKWPSKDYAKLVGSSLSELYSAVERLVEADEQNRSAIASLREGQQEVLRTQREAAEQAMMVASAVSSTASQISQLRDQLHASQREAAVAHSEIGTLHN